MTQPQVTSLTVPVAPAGGSGFISATTAPKSLVFKPGATFPDTGGVQQNVFTTPNASGPDGFVMLQNVLRGLGLGPAIPLPSSLVEVDCSLNGDNFNCTAAVNFGKNCTLRGLTNQATNAQAQFGTSGFAVAGITSLENLRFRVSGATTVPGAMARQLDLHNAILESLDGNVYNSMNQNVTINLYEGSAIGDNAQTVLDVQAGRDLTINDYGGAVLGATAITRGAGARLFINVLAGTGAGIDPSYFNVAGVIIAWPTPTAASVTFQPGGAAHVPSVFTDFAQLCAYIRSVGVSALGWTIQVDGSFSGGNPVIPTGTYAVPDSVTFEGLTLGGGFYPTLTLAADVTFTGTPTEVTFKNIQVAVQNAVGDVLTYAGISPIVTFDNTQISNSAGKALFAFTTAATPLLIGGGLFGAETSFAGAGIITADATSNLTLSLSGGAGLNPGAIALTAGGTCVVDNDATCPVDAVVGTTGFTFTYTDRAARVDNGAANTNVAGNVTLTNVFGSIRADTTAGDVNYTLPAVSTIPDNGFRYWIWLETSGGAGAHSVTVVPNGGAGEMIGNVDTGAYQAGATSTVLTGNVQNTLILVEWNSGKNAWMTSLSVPGVR